MVNTCHEYVIPAYYKIPILWFYVRKTSQLDTKTGVMESLIQCYQLALREIVDVALLQHCSMHIQGYSIIKY